MIHDMTNNKGYFGYIPVTLRCMLRELYLFSGLLKLTQAIRSLVAPMVP